MLNAIDIRQFTDILGYVDEDLDIGKPGKAPVESGTVLVVEDDESIAEFLKFFLQDLDHDVVIADNGVEGLRLARATKPVLILLDLSLPGLDGWELARRLTSDSATCHIPMLAVTGATWQAAEDERARAVGLAGYISKPFEVADLEEKIRPFLYGYQSSTATEA
jgi:CheY-like chemotaxis protein